MFSKLVLYFLFVAVFWIAVTAETCTDPNAHWSETDATICQTTCERPDYCRPAGPVAGCVCNIGYLKSGDGTCILSEKCAVIETCEDPNAEFSMSMATECQNTCESPDFQSVCRPIRPQAGCVCKPGFVKNKRDRCVTLGECGKEVCGINENMVSCLNPCPPEDCSTIGIRFSCQTPDPSECTPGCRCAFNYRRDDRGICIPIERCPPLTCIGANEVYDPCPPICPGEECSQASLNGICPYRIGIRLPCSPFCRCQNGFFRKNVANESVCVSREECSES